MIDLEVTLEKKYNYKMYIFKQHKLSWGHCSIATEHQWIVRADIRKAARLYNDSFSSTNIHQG